MVWRCTLCGEDHPEDNPPCDKCGHSSFEQVETDDGSESDEEDVRLWTGFEADDSDQEASSPDEASTKNDPTTSTEFGEEDDKLASGSEDESSDEESTSDETTLWTGPDKQENDPAEDGDQSASLDAADELHWGGEDPTDPDESVTDDDTGEDPTDPDESVTDDDTGEDPTDTDESVTDDDTGEDPTDTDESVTDDDTGEDPTDTDDRRGDEEDILWVDGSDGNGNDGSTSDTDDGETEQTSYEAVEPLWPANNEETALWWPEDPDPVDEDEHSGQPWVCTNCGQMYDSNSPPCDRCGNVTLKQGRQSDDASAGWIASLTRLSQKQVAGVALGGVLLLVLSIALSGAIGLGATPVEGPTPPDVPGYDDRWNGYSLPAVEGQLVSAINDDRRVANETAFRRGRVLDAMAEYYNKRRIEATYADGATPDLSELQAFSPRCGGADLFVIDFTLVSPQTVRTSDAVIPESRQLPAEFDDQRQMATVIADSGDISLSNGSVSNHLSQRSLVTNIGVDVHVAPNQNIDVTVVTC